MKLFLPAMLLAASSATSYVAEKHGKPNGMRHALAAALLLLGLSLAGPSFAEVSYRVTNGAGGGSGLGGSAGTGGNGSWSCKNARASPRSGLKDR